MRSGAASFEQLLVLETGKPLVDCRVEVDRTLLTLTTAAEEVARLHGETVPLDLLPSGEGLLGFWVRRPIGVVVGIAGYNYPLLLASHKLAPAARGRVSRWWSSRRRRPRSPRCGSSTSSARRSRRPVHRGGWSSSSPVGWRSAWR